MKKIKVLILIIVVVLLILIGLNSITNLELKTETIIDAPKEKVWEVLTDTQNYPNWNPFIISVEGEMKQGSKITNVMVNNKKETVFTPIITMYKENEALEWLGSGLGGMFKGRHYFKLEEIDNDKTRLLHGETFSGLLSGLIMQMIGEDTQANFENMNSALKGVCEKE